MFRKANCKFGTALLFIIISSAILIWFTDPAWLAPSDTIQVITLLVLVIVTFWYAKSTKDMSRAANGSIQIATETLNLSQKGYELALNSEKNSLLPVIIFDVLNSDAGRLRVSYQNVGKGPALDFRIWPEGSDDLFKYLESDAYKNRWHRSGIGVNQGGECEWNEKNRVLPTDSSGLNIVAEYTDVFRRPLLSRLTVIGPHDEDFKFGEA